MLSAEYRHHAAECLRIAESTSDPQYRASLVAMAQSCMALAKHAQKRPQPNEPET